MLRRILTITGYTAAGLFILIATAALVAYGKGYTYDFKNHRFVLNGLVILETTPDRAKVFVDGQDSREETPFRNTIEAGTYTFEVTKPGYRSWRKTLDVRPSEVTFAEYVLLFPEKIESVATKLGRSAFGLVASPSRKQLAYLDSGRGGGVWLFDGESKQSRRLYSARSGEVPVSVTWSGDNSRLLLLTRLKGKSNHIMLAASGQPSAQNLTNLFNQDFRQLKFNPATSNELYWVSPQGNLHRLNLSDRTASAVLAGKVSAFGFGGGRVFYVQETKLGKSLFSLERSTIKKQLVQSLAESPSYEILHHRFDGRDYLMVVPSRARTATLYEDIFSQHPVAQPIAQSIDHIKRSPDGQFLVAYNASTIVTYDLDKKKRREFDLAIKSISELEWYDEFHLLVSADGKTYVTEFDGANLTELGASIPGSAFVGPEGKEIFGLSKGGSEIIGLRVRR